MPKVMQAFSLSWVANYFIKFMLLKPLSHVTASREI